MAYFGALLRQSRLERGWSQAQLGRAVFVSGDLLAKIEKAERRPQPDLVDRLDEALETAGQLQRAARRLGTEAMPRPRGSGRKPDDGPDLVVGFEALVEAMLDVVASARECLVATGSRSNEPVYLDAVESAVERRPRLVHHRVLYGPPLHDVFTEHLERLLDTQPRRHSSDEARVNVSLVEVRARATAGDAERFFVASERKALAIVASVVTPGGFDTGVRLSGAHAAGLVHHGLQAHDQARRVTALPQVLVHAPAPDPAR